MDELKRIDLNLLVTLRALLAERHVTRAAVRLNKSQPAVSHALAQLRRHFDDPLLVRRNRRLTLTTKAQQLVEPLDQALDSLNALLAVPDFDPLRASRRFRLAMSDYAVRVILPHLVRHLRAAAPGIDLAISQGSSREALIGQLIDGEIDLAFSIFPELPPDIRSEILFEEHFVSIADKTILPQAGPLTLEDWLSRPHIMLALRPDAVDEIDIALSALGLQRRIALALPHWSAAVDLLPGTDLILTVASRAVTSVRPHDDLQLFAPPFPIPQIDYRQAWHVRRESDPAHRWLRRVILEEAGGWCGSLMY